MKRHNALEHGGHMSRSKRNAALRIPTSFTYRRNEQEQHRGRGRGFHQDPSDDQLSIAIQASLETAAAADGRFQDSSFGAHFDSENRRTRRANAFTGSSEVSTVNEGPEASVNQNTRTTPILEESSFPPLSDRELPEPSSRYVQALSQISRNPVKLREESFPPLPGAANKPKPTHGLEGSSANTLAARLQRNRGSIVINSAPPRPLEYHEIFPSASQLRTVPNHGIASSTSTSSQPRANRTRENGFRSPSSASSVNSDATNTMRHSVSAPNLTGGSSSNQAIPSVKGEESLPLSNQSHTSVSDIHTANKSLVEQIQASLGMDEDKYSAFKSISLEYRQGVINTSEYLSYAEQFGLSHLVPELARLCPIAQKQKELIDAYNVNLRNKGLQEKASNMGGSKGKGRISTRAESKAKNTLTDNFLDTVKKLQLNQKAQEEDVEVLSKDGYRVSKDKPQSPRVSNSGATNANSIEISVDRAPYSVTDIAKPNLTDAGSSKQRKKTSKFHRARLGDGSAAALDLSRRDVNPEPQENGTIDGSSETIPVRGVWRSGGAQRLFANSSRNG
ncbi:uncharacterized protein LOC141816418 isoform X1 [Curcuma longa]